MHAPALEILDLSRRGHQELALAGELDCATMRLLDELLDSQDGTLYLDLSCTTFADSCLLHSLERQAERGRRIVVTGVSRAVQGLLSAFEQPA